MVKARLLASIIDLWHCIGLLALLTSFLLGIGKVPEGLALPRARECVIGCAPAYVGYFWLL